MELHELQKMISIIHDKKPRCRGNLRVKVLLKSTHDYVRRSLIDDQLGNSESLLTLLRNSGSEPMSSGYTTSTTNLHLRNSEQTFSALETDPHSMDCDQISEHVTAVVSDQNLVSSNSCNESMKLSENISVPNEAFFKSEDDFNQNHAQTEGVTGKPGCSRVCKNSNKNFYRTYNDAKDKLFSVAKMVRNLMKNWDLLMSKAKRDNSYLKRHSVKRMRKMLLVSKVCFKLDFENQSFSRQRLIQAYLTRINKMIKKCDKMLDTK